MLTLILYNVIFEVIKKVFLNINSQYLPTESKLSGLKDTS